jgi:hypothetical protein
MDMTTTNGELALDHQGRIAKRQATWQHALRALTYFGEQMDDDGYDQLKGEMTLLESYWNRPGVTKEQAVAAYFADHLDAAERAFAKRKAAISACIRQLREDVFLLNERRKDRGLPPVFADLSFPS